ncbi:anti-sigma factor [Gloeobacter violaceus]|uniref:Regulator of SigK n=1 Tax=Gloeobacter violaceus (strain ATCC 29082 / PCC 7421) TaxID=251221 RepID=Q7NJR7_GLOVI|nr:anti-sigma factor [Gloeobacter violaceus]BAC89706.1 glr1765 [Gloeobacter violaceus PCC 7421]
MYGSPGPKSREDLMIEYVLGELSRRSPQEAEKFEQLLAQDLALKREVQQLRKVLGLLPYATVSAPPKHLRTAILDAAAAPPRRAGGPRISPGWIAAVAAACVAAVFGIDGFRLRQQLQAVKEANEALQQPNLLLQFSLIGTGPLSNAFGSVAMDLDTKRAAVAINNLPTAPAGQVYRLWAITGNKTVPCGQFNPGAGGKVITQFAIPVEAYSGPIAQLLVTLEPASLPAQPTGPSVLVTG